MSALTPDATGNRTWEKSFTTLKTRQAQSLQTLGRLQENAVAAYDFASDSLLAAKGGKGLGNPFKGRTAAEIDEMFKAKGFEPRGPDPLNGKGGYVNPKTGRS